LEQPSGLVVSGGVDSLACEPPVAEPARGGEVVFVVADDCDIFDEDVEVAEDDAYYVVFEAASEQSHHYCVYEREVPG